MDDASIDGSDVRQHGHWPAAARDTGAVEADEPATAGLCVPTSHQAQGQQTPTRSCRPNTQLPSHRTDLILKRSVSRASDVAARRGKSGARSVRTVLPGLVPTRRQVRHRSHAMPVPDAVTTHGEVTPSQDMAGEPALHPAPSGYNPHAQAVDQYKHRSPAGVLGDPCRTGRPAACLWVGPKASPPWDRLPGAPSSPAGTPHRRSLRIPRSSAHRLSTSGHRSEERHCCPLRGPR